MSDRHKVKIFLREWREHRGLTVHDLAERVGCEPISISRVERGDRDWSSSMLAAFAKALAVEPLHLLADPSEQTMAHKTAELVKLHTGDAPEPIPFQPRVPDPSNKTEH